MGYKMTLVMALSLLTASINTQAMDQKPPMVNFDNFDVADESFKGTLLEHLPKDLNSPLRKNMVLFTFKCPTVEELITRGGKVDYKDANGVVFTTGLNPDRIPDGRSVFRFLNKYQDKEFKNVAIRGDLIVCWYGLKTDDNHLTDDLTVDFKTSGISINQVSYDPNLMRQNTSKVGNYLTGPNGVNVEFSVRPPK